MTQTIVEVGGMAHFGDCLAARFNGKRSRLAAREVDLPCTCPSGCPTPVLSGEVEGVEGNPLQAGA